MNRYRTIPGLGPQKASASTVCQKCLKKDIYECKASVQERPYASRPSRSQQFANPKLAPKLTSDNPNELLLSKGVADKQLAEAEASRQQQDRRRSASPTDAVSPQRRHRSPTASSVDSVSTISTDKSKTRSPSPRRTKIRGRIDDERRNQTRSSTRSTSRGRKRKHRSMSSSSSSSSSSRSPPSYPESHRKNRRHRTISPDHRGRPSSFRRGSHRSRSSSISVDKSQITKQRRSLNSDRQSPNGPSGQTDKRRGEGEPDRRQDRNVRQSDRAAFDQNIRHARRERSLSPYSRRLALTQAMNMGR